MNTEPNCVYRFIVSQWINAERFGGGILPFKIGQRLQ